MNPVAAGDTFPEKLNPLYGDDQIVRDGCMWKTMWMPCCQPRHSFQEGLTAIRRTDPGIHPLSLFDKR